MTTVAWNGDLLAVDKQATYGDGQVEKTTKIRLGSDAVVTWTGIHECGLMLAQWWMDGAKQDAWPAFQQNDDAWTRLIVAYTDGRCWVYERLPVPQLVEEPFMAWGSGAHYALGAMYAGMDPELAVMVASRYDSKTGLGVDVVELPSLKVRSDP